MTPTTSILDTLRSLLPIDYVGEREDKPIVSPRTAEEVAAFTRFAQANQLAIEIVGAGTKRSWGNPVAAEILLDTTRLTGVRQHSWQDLTATVAAGTRWADMQRVLAEHNQFVALDPLWPETATVGGIVATNDSGALRLRYGSLRDLIIGMTIVLADGTIAHSGGKVVKNVAGYDLHKLMTGAFGTLGVITEVTFRLHPLPKHAQTFTVSAARAQQLAPLMAAIRDSHLLVEAMQLRGDSSGFHLDVQFNAHPDAMQAEVLDQMAKSHRLTLEGGLANTWSSREDLISMSNGVLLKISVPPSSVTRMSDQIIRDEGRTVAQSLGIIYASFPVDSEAPTVLPASLEHLGLSVIADEGSIVWLHGPSELAREMDIWAPMQQGGSNASGVSALMREIRRQFDPKRILNPGRFLGGI